MTTTQTWLDKRGFSRISIHAEELHETRISNMAQNSLSTRLFGDDFHNCARALHKQSLKLWQVPNFFSNYIIGCILFHRLWRYDNSQRLFISFKKPLEPVSSATIEHNFKAHSTRSAASSAAKYSDMSIVDLLKLDGLGPQHLSVSITSPYGENTISWKSWKIWHTRLQ